jgi:LCP family protein required for cell wall assembly
MPQTVLFLGTDVVYSKDRRVLKADPASFQGRSDSMILARFDPIGNRLTVLSIPRDTEVKIPGFGGLQKINGANAYGGPQLAAQTIYGFLGIPVDHYIVLNVHGLVEVIDELGGIDVDIPKRMHYTDNSAKLHIDLEPGRHHLNGTEAMGFVRFRHDALGDIGRVQRQQIFLDALKQKALDPMSFAKAPKLFDLAQSYVLTDMDSAQLLRLAAFARAVPKENQQMIMLPGRFTGTGNWGVDDADVHAVVARFSGRTVAPNSRESIRMTVENASDNPDQGRRVFRYLSNRGYYMSGYKSKPDAFGDQPATTHIIAQRGNIEDARLVKKDLFDHGDIVNASVGDIQSSVTVVVGNDLNFIDVESAQQPARRRHQHRHG